MKPLSEVAPRLLEIQIQIQAVWDQSENPGELITQLMMSSLYSTGPPEGPIFEGAVVLTDQKTRAFVAAKN